MAGPLPENQSQEWYGTGESPLKPGRSSNIDDRTAASVRRIDGRRSLGSFPSLNSGLGSPKKNVKHQVEDADQYRAGQSIGEGVYLKVRLHPLAHEIEQEGVNHKSEETQ